MRLVRAFTVAVGVSLGVPLAFVGPSVRGYAAPACAVPAPASTVTAEIPWAQRRFGLGRLSGVADGAGVVVAVVDSGVDAANPQLTGAVLAGLDALDGGGDGRLDCIGHGTAVASIIAARPRSGSGLVGVAPAATILPIRVSERTDNETGGRSAPTSSVAAALRTAVDRGARVVNMSLTTDQDDPALREAVRQAIAHDVVVVAAAGNRREAGNPRTYPAAYDGVLGVGAVRPDGVRTAESQTGDYVDVLAPGAEIIAATRGVGQARYAGTSFAAAFVSGTAALVRQYLPQLTAAQVAERLKATADAGPEATAVLNPYRAVTGWTSDGAARAAAPVPAKAPPSKRPRDRLDQRAGYLAAGGAIAAVLILIAGSALPKAARRRWTAAGPA